ncbi:MAG: glycosyltransferase family 39 protein [Desulfobacterales bacterium]|nr:glycosyltransferase family 39 protein [Desulfobacterales bacterium]
MQRQLDSKPYAAFLAAVVLFSLFIGLGSVPLFDEDEGAYSEVTREMLQSGDFVTPRLNGDTFFHKPPMIYWVQAASVKLFGLNEFALRLPSALASVAWLLLLFRFARRYFNSAVAWYAVFFVATSLQTSIVAKAAIADALLNLFVTLAMFSIYAYYRHERKRDIYLTFVLMALGFLTKGPIAILIPFVASGVFFGIKRRWALWFKAIFNPLGWGLLLLIALPWYVALYLQHGRGFIDEIFFTHNVSRFQTAFEGHSGSLFYYIPVILIGMIPHTAFLIKAATRTRALLKDELNLYLAIWFVFVFILFSLAGTKLHHYILYGYIPLFLFMAQAVGHLRHFRSQLVWPLGLIAVLFFLPQIAALVQPRIADEFASLVLAGALSNFRWGYQTIMGLALVTLGSLWFIKSVSEMARTVIVGVVVITAVNFGAVPIAGSIMQQPVKDAALLSREKGYTVNMWQMSYHSFSVYRQGLVVKGTPRNGDIVITKINKLKDVHRYQVLYQKHGIVLARIIEL